VQSLKHNFSAQYMKTFNWKSTDLAFDIDNNGIFLSLISKFSIFYNTVRRELTTTCLQRPSYSSPNLGLHNINQNLPLNNDHLSTTATHLGFQGWSLYITGQLISDITKKLKPASSVHYNHGLINWLILSEDDHLDCSLKLSVCNERNFGPFFTIFFIVFNL
jgi:hypothetical protein